MADSNESPVMTAAATSMEEDDRAMDRGMINFADLNNVEDAAPVPREKKHVKRVRHKQPREPKEKGERSSSSATKKEKKRKRTDAVGLGFIDEEVEVSSDEEVSDDELDDEADGFIEGLVAEEEGESADSDDGLTKEERRALREERRERKRRKREALIKAGLKPDSEDDIDEEDYRLLQEQGVNIHRSIDDDIVQRSDEEEEEERSFRRIKKGVDRNRNSSAVPSVAVPASAVTTGHRVDIEDILNADIDADDDQTMSDHDTSAKAARRVTSVDETFEDDDVVEGDDVSEADEGGHADDDAESPDSRVTMQFNDPVLKRLFGDKVGSFFASGRLADAPITSDGDADMSESAAQQAEEADEADQELEADLLNEELDDEERAKRQAAAKERRQQQRRKPTTTTTDEASVAANAANIRIQSMSDWLERVRSTDIPERQQVRVQRRINVYGDDKAAQQNEIAEETAWIMEKHFYKRKDLTKESIENALKYIRVEHFEVPFIHQYRREYVKELSEDDLWQIDQLDDRYDELAAKRKRLLAVVEKLAPDDTRLLDTVQFDWANVTDLDDVQDYLNYLLDVRDSDQVLAATADALSLSQSMPASFQSTSHADPLAVMKSASSETSANGSQPALPPAIADRRSTTTMDTTSAATATTRPVTSDAIIQLKANITFDADQEQPISMAFNLAPSTAATTSTSEHTAATSSIDSLLNRSSDNDTTAPSNGTQPAANGIASSLQQQPQPLSASKPHDKRKHRIGGKASGTAADRAFLRQFTSRGLQKLADKIGISGRELADNLKLEWTQHVFPESLYDIEFEAEQYVDEKYRYADVAAVLKDVRKFVSLSLSYDIKLRKYVRQRYQKNALINTTPTVKGQREITDDSHSYYNVRQLVNEPIYRFEESSQWLVIEKAEQEGYINVSITLPTSDRGRYHDDDMNGVAESKNPALFKLLCELYLSTKHSYDADQWNEQRHEVMRNLVDTHLSKIGHEHVRHTLHQQATDYVIKRADMKLDAILRSGAYQPTQLDVNDEKSRNFRIVSLVYGERDAASSLVVLNRYGNVIDHVVLHFLKARAEAVDRDSKQLKSDEDLQLYQRKKQDITAFHTLLRNHRVQLIVMDACNQDAVNFKNELENKILVGLPNVKAELVDPTVGRLYSTSDRSVREFKDYTADLRRSICQGRFVLDPVSEIAAMWGTVDYDEAIAKIAASQQRGNIADIDAVLHKLTPTKNDILNLNLHPMQSLISKEQLLNALKRRLIRVINHIGVDINKVIPRSFLSHTLQFVAGFGPIKAKAVIDFCKGYGYCSSREQLSKAHEGPLDEVVYRNAAAFIRIHRVSSDSFRSSRGTANYNILDETRVHPDSYKYAKQIALDALDAEDDSDSDDAAEAESDDDLDAEDEDRADFTRITRRKQRRDNERIERVMTAKGIKEVEKLDLEEYAKTEERDSGDKCFDTLMLIKEELKHPYTDKLGYSSNLKPLTPTRLFQLITSETDATLHVGMLVPSMVVAHAPGGIITKLEDGIKGWIPINSFSDSKRPDGDDNKAWLAGQVPAGQTIEARVTMVDIKRMSLQLSSRETDVKQWDTRRTLDLWKAEREAFRDDADHDLELWQLHDDYNVKQTEEERETERQKKLQAAQKPSYTPRNIVHALFKNVDRQGAIELLQNSPVGDCLFRPATGRVTHLTITWKIDEDIYWHVDVTEEQKPNPFELGKQLLVNVTDKNKASAENTYHDIDEVLVRYIEPSNKLIGELIANKRFRHGNQSDVDEMLRAEKLSATSATIPYAVHFAGYGENVKGGGFVFTYIASGDRIKNIPFAISPAGFKFNNKIYPSADAVIGAIKRHLAGGGAAARQTPQQRHQVQQQRPPARTSQYAVPPPAAVARPPPQQPQYAAPPPQPPYNSYPAPQAVYAQQQYQPPSQPYPVFPSMSMQPAPHHQYAAPPPQQYGSNYAAPPQQQQYQYRAPPPQQPPPLPPPAQPPAHDPSYDIGRNSQINPARLAMLQGRG